MRILSPRLILLALALYLGFNVFFEINRNLGIGQVEYGVFNAYAESIAKDGDLNIINQLPASFAWIAGPKYSDVDYHDYGLVSVSAPWMILAKWLDFNKDPEIYQKAFALLNIALAAGIFFLIHGISRELLNTAEDSKGRLFLFLANIPFWWYVAFHINGSDIGTTFLVTLIVHFYLKHFRQTGLKVLFLQSLLFAIATTAKITVWFSIFVWLHYLYVHRFNFRLSLKLLAAFSLSFFAVYSFHFAYLINKYGVLYSGYAQDIEVKIFVLKEILFSQNGYLVSSPVYWLCIWGFFRLPSLKKISPESKSFLAIMFAAFVIKLIAVSFRPIEDELFGSRMILVDSYLFFTLWMSLWKSSAGKSSGNILTGILCLGALYNIYLIGIFWHDTDSWNGTYNFNAGNSLAGLENIASAIERSEFLRPILANWPLLILAAVILALGFSTWRLSPKNALASVVAFMSFSFFGSHILNFLNSEKNIQSLRQKGFYADKLITKGPRMFKYDDTISILHHSMYYAKARNDQEGYRIRENLLQNYLKDIKSEVLVDPLHFLDDLNQGKARKSAHED